MQRYNKAALSYYQMEWQDPKDTTIVHFQEEVEKILDFCRVKGDSVPNAAKDIEIFLRIAKGKS